MAWHKVQSSPLQFHLLAADLEKIICDVGLDVLQIVLCLTKIRIIYSTLKKLS